MGHIMDRAYNLLFISRRNSARSVMAEAVVNKRGNGKFRAFSAAVEPSEVIDPVAIEVLDHAGYATEGLHPKHWQEFTGADAPILDFVFTLSDTASSKEFPAWPGTPVSSHWRYPDPTKAKGEVWERRLEYGKTLSAIERQMRIFMQLPFDALDRVALDKRLSEMSSG